MSRRVVSLLILAAVGVLVAAPASGSAAPAKRACDVLEYGGDQYVFFKQGIACGKAQKWARKVHRNPSWEPRHWDCESGSNFETGGSCFLANRPNERFFGWHPFD
jgi:hypothetical protein